MRGKNKIYTNFYELNSKENGVKKGRSKALNNKRNLVLIHRYFFYSKFTKLRYEAIIEILSEEFYLSVATIPELIDDNFSLLKEVNKTSPTVTNLKTDFPHLNWTLKGVETKQ